MARILLLVILVTVAAEAAHKHHPKFPKSNEEYVVPEIRKVACSSESERLRSDIIEKSKCGLPKDIFIDLKPQAAHQQISPGAVWVKRCVGLCDYDTYGSKCIPLKKTITHIPVRIYNVKTNKEACSTYAVEEHLECGCCPGTPQSCQSPRVYDPRKCTCRCPNRKEKRNCRSKPNQIMRWNPSKCRCEVKPKRLVTKVEVSSEVNLIHHFNDIFV
ncbi:balbiani ring protein 3-like [Hyposmocoma kahamanoa]|uniref:balbiani ring protein 3-like n=1 Tax=Hyposmocoma kahamanoa TaxID=1477025 RepID=UPI000E6D68C0|nr:balbiani ring protein 3-like [Hyposmocoma kahamanoa]